MDWGRDDRRRECAISITICFAGQCKDKITEIGGLHAGITAVLIDLIAGSFNENWFVIVAVAAENRAQGFRMRGAVRRDASMVPCPAGRNSRPHVRCAKNVSISVRVLLPSIGPILVTAKGLAALAYAGLSKEMARLNHGDEVHLNITAPVGSTT